jgi:predicted transcriptional regulator
MSKLSDPEKRTMQLRISKELFRRIALASVRYDRSRSALIRDVMASWLEREAQRAAASTPSHAPQRPGGQQVVHSEGV